MFSVFSYIFKCMSFIHLYIFICIAYLIHIFSVSRRLSSNSNSSICSITFWYPLFMKKSSVLYTSKEYRDVLNESSTSLRHASPLFLFHPLSRPSSLLFHTIFLSALSFVNSSPCQITFSIILSSRLSRMLFENLRMLSVIFLFIFYFQCYLGVQYKQV